MNSALLQHLLSSENEFNKRYGAPFPLYKFHRFYADRTNLSDEERQSQLFVENGKRTGFHVFNPFLISLLREHSIWSRAFDLFQRSLGRRRRCVDPQDRRSGGVDSKAAVR